MRPDRALLPFAAAVFVFHIAPAFLGPTGDRVDLITPFAVIGSAAALLAALEAPTRVLVFALLAGVLYVSGHGIHLAANAIAREELTGDAERVARFWDEDFSHVWWHLGWLGLIFSFCLAEGRRVRTSRAARVGTVLLLGFALFASTVEGRTWWLALAAAVPLTAWAVLRPRPLLVTCAFSFAAAALLMAAWALWHGGMPEFSEVGLI